MKQELLTLPEHLSSPLPLIYVGLSQSPIKSCRSLQALYLCKRLDFTRFFKNINILRYSSFLHISLVLTWNMIFFEAKYHFRKAILIGPIFLWNIFLFWVIWFTYSSDKMSTLDIIVKYYDKNIMLRDCQRQTFEYLHQKLSHDRSLHDHVFWNYFWDAYRDRKPARTDNSVWEIGVFIAQ